MLGGGDSEDLAAQGDALDPLLSAFRRLGLQGGRSADGWPQPTTLVGEAPDQFQPTLSLDPQLLQERRLLGRDLADFAFRELPSSPFQPRKYGATLCLSFRSAGSVGWCDWIARRDAFRLALPLWLPATPLHRNSRPIPVV